LDSLARLGLGHGDVDRIVLSHLHFDHAGGLLAPHRTGRPIELAFQRAEIVVGKTALERAERPHPRDRASFIPGLPELLRASGRLRVVDGPAEANALLGPRYSFVETNGHTPGMLHAAVRGESANLLFCADLIPGRAWLHAPITMGYDRFPEHLVDEKSDLLATAIKRETMLVYTHDLEVAASRVMVGNGNRYQPSEAVGDFSRWDLDSDRLPARLDAAS
jgi:glyoxylase-like metal-dependent hydrolase (beta-lactamase superfamily II)